MPATQNSRTPFLDAMMRYVGDRVLPFHTPGHKAGRGFPGTLKQLLGSGVLDYDLTFIPELGDLYENAGPLRESQRLLAGLYGADRSFYLINGTTGGIHAMMAACLRPGDKVLLPRNVHRSVIGGLILTGATPAFFQPIYDAQRKIALQVTVNEARAAISKNPDAKAVLITHPTYHGVGCDIRTISNMAHSAGMLLLVDEAHGAHLHFAAGLPESALDAGADVVVQSAHKTLGVLSQGSWLHCRGGRVDSSAVAKWLELLQSSSPSYILLASLEAACDQLTTQGRELVGRSVAIATAAQERIRQIPGLTCLHEEAFGRPGIYSLDPTKLLVTVTGLGLTGPDAAAWLRKERRVQVELADSCNLLFLVTLADTMASSEALVDSLEALVHCHFKNSISTNPLQQTVAVPSELPVMVASPRQVVKGKQEGVAIEASCGRVSAETVYCYPPGIAFLIPGEEISSMAVDYLLHLRQTGQGAMGLEDAGLRTIKVVTE